MNQHLKILSSDDDEGTRALLFSLLTEHGHEVDFARDSDEVFKNLGRTRYDLLILDVNTPGINGYKVAEKISGNITNRPKMLIFTARNIRNEELQFTISGADAIITKGTPCDKIIAVIHDLFSDKTVSTLPSPTRIGAEPLMLETHAQLKSSKISKKLNEDLQFCLSKMSQVEDLINLKNMRYEGFIRDLLKEKQRTEKNYLEFKRIEEEVVGMKNWGYAVTAMASLAIIRSFFK